MDITFLAFFTKLRGIMPANRLSMKHVKHILELHFEEGLSIRAIARGVGIGCSSVGRILDRAKVANVRWPLPEGTSDADLERILYPSPTQSGSVGRELPDWMEVYKELARHRSLTLHQLWTEYIERNPQGYQYSYFCELYREWRGCHEDPTMRITRKAGERLFVDYSGKKLRVTHPITGETRTVELFVAALGASGYMYAEATETQKTFDFRSSIGRAFQFYGGVTRMLVPDNLKSAIIKFRKDDVPILNDSLRELADFFRVGVVPARPRRPKDKGLVESSVLLIQRRLGGALRNLEFFGLGELNEAILDQVQELNEALMQKTKVSRKELFEGLDRPMLRPLPREPYEYMQWVHKRKVGSDYHVHIENHKYSVPHSYLGRQVEARLGPHTVEIFAGSERIASHVRSRESGKYTTVKDHMPKHHREYEKWSPKRYIQWAESIGPRTKALIEVNLASFEVPEQAFNRCNGTLILAREYGHEAMEMGCELALRRNTRTTAAVRQLVKQMAAESHQPKQLSIDHENIRGAAYYSTKDPKK